MARDGACALREIAAGRVGRVELCSHGTLHLTLGALTLRLTRTQIMELASTLESAVAHLDHSGYGPEPRARLLC